MRKEITSREIEESWLNHIEKESDISPDTYPVLSNISSAFIFQLQIVPKNNTSPEFIYIPINHTTSGIKTALFVSEWNLSWECAQLRHEFFYDKLLNELEWLKNYEEHNIYFLPRAKNNNYYATIPIYHMLPAKVLKNYGLPLLKKGIWPFIMRNYTIENHLPHDFDTRVSNAFAQYIWPLLNPRTKQSAFSKEEPIKLLAHNLDFWLPYINSVAENRLKQLPRCECENLEQKELINKVSKDAPDEVKVARPRMGGYVWFGEDEAWQAAHEMVELADSNGKLRSILDAIKSNRLEEDFSAKWSYEREDFERKLYKKRSKYRVKFVELADTIPVQGPETEVESNLFWENFMGMLDLKEKQIIVLIRNGYTKVGEISNILGYANHSPVSKALKRIRKKLDPYLDS